jgi:hypothetical protein
MLTKFAEWQEKNHRFRKIMAIIAGIGALIEAWYHMGIPMIICCICIIIYLRITDNRGPDNRDDSPDPEPDTPNGDVVDKWLRSQRLTRV